MARPTKPFYSKGVPEETAVDFSGAHSAGYEYRHKVGAWLRQKRHDAELTQVQVANLLGVRETAISAIETGRNTIPPERYAAFAAALGIPEDEFGWFVLRYDNPWLYQMIYGSKDRRLQKDLASIPERLGINPFAPKGISKNDADSTSGRSRKR